MENIVEQIVTGRKTFFIAPDRGLFPETYLEEYLADGFECYFIDPDLTLPIELKIDVILSVFKDSILFFNIDAPLPDTTWPSLIKKIHSKYPDALFGVTYAKRKTDLEKQALEHLYLMDLGLQCGCIELQYQKKNNYSVIERVLFANQAMGRRKKVRAVCKDSCKVKMRTKDKVLISEDLSDISLSHFSINIKDRDAHFDEFEKMRDVQFFIKGQRMSSDVVLFMSRPVSTGMLYVFAFTTKDGKPGLDDFSKPFLTKKIYEIMQENSRSLLDQVYKTVAKQMANSN